MSDQEAELNQLATHVANPRGSGAPSRQGGSLGVFQTLF